MFSGILVCLLVFSLALISCPTGGDDGEYDLLWGTFSTSISLVKSTISSHSWSVTDTDSGNACYATGATAENIYTYSLNTLTFSDGGSKDGSWEELLNYKKNGIGLDLAPALKTAMLPNKENAPVAGIYDSGQGFAVIFYIRKN